MPVSFLGLVAGVSIACGTHVRAKPVELPASVVDYLKSTGRETSMEARRTLFETYRPTEKYTGSAAQNVFLRNALVADDHAPRVEQTDQLFRSDETIHLKLLKPARSVESELKGVCEDVTGGAHIDVGAAKAGIYGLRVLGDHAAAEGVLLIVPSGDRLRVLALLNGQPELTTVRASEQLVTVTGESEASVKQKLERIPGALERFGSRLAGAPVAQSFKTATRAWIQKPGNVAKAITTGTVCTVWAGATVSPIPGAGRATWGFCWDSIKDPAQDLLFDVLDQIVQDTPGLDGADKDALGFLFKSLKSTVDVIALTSIRDDNRALEAIEKALAGVQILADQLEEGPVKITIQVFAQSGKKHVIALKILRKTP